ncbi:9579_t:CDS:2, partial [Gigaspora rosea]
MDNLVDDYSSDNLSQNDSTSNILAQTDSSTKWLQAIFFDREHDEYLILDVLNGLRPKIPINIPQDLVELIERLHQDPAKRVSNNIDFEYECRGLIREAEYAKLEFPKNK